MKRVPEPEVMNAPDQARAYADADFEEVNQGLVDRFVAAFPEIRRGPLLDLGTGPVDIPIRFCRALPELHVHAVDAASNMLAIGHAALATTGFADRVTIVQAYLPQLPFRDHAFPAVFSNSLLHHLHSGADLWSEIARLGQPGAPVFVADLFRPDSVEEARRIVGEADCSDDPVLQHDFYASLLAAYTREEIRGQLDAAGLGQLQVEQISERHVLVWGRLA